MLLHRYHDIDRVVNLPAEIGFQLIEHAEQEKRDERIWLQWAIQLPLMSFAGDVMSFETYKQRATGANIDLTPTADLMAELDEIEMQFEDQGRSGVDGA